MYQYSSDYSPLYDYIERLYKTKYVSWAWWRVPVIPATCEGGGAEAEICLNPGGGGCNELRLCHCIPAWVTQRDSISNKQTNKNQKLTRHGGGHL